MSVDVKTNVIKRNGEEVDFNSQKIINAVHKANEEVDRLHQMNDYQIIAIADNIANKVNESTHAVNVEDIQDMVETGIMAMRGYEVAQKYVRYRYKRELTRKSNTTDNGILSLLDNINEEVNQENSNKNPVINSTQRDYMAGEVSKDLSRRVLLPEEIVRAHEEGIIHFHDTDYFAQREHNCDLINLEDMLQNGTVISETLIEKPHSFFTACNVTTQIVAQVASNQYGGQSFTLAHLAPFVDISRQKIRKNVIEERKECGESLDEAIISKVTERRLRDEVRSGIQTIQYQLITLMTCNGQAPFVTVFMYLDEVPEGQTRDDLAMIIEEVLVQRMQGVKIQEFLSTKAAAMTMVEYMMNLIGLTMKDVGRFYVAGAFGTHIDKEAAVTIGLYPDIERDKIISPGNTSLLGARKLLLDRSLKDRAKEIIGRMQYVQFGAVEDFIQLMAAAKAIPHTDLKRFPSVERRLKERSKGDL